MQVESHSQERPAAVSFAVEPDGKALPDRWRYKASYSRNGKTARFGMEFLIAKAKPGGGPAFGMGSFIADPKSYDADLLRDLAKLLKASSMPQWDIRVRQLPFKFVIEGENLDRGSNGDLIDAATGNWVKTRIFLGPRFDQEMFLNFQKPGGRGEFMAADPAFGMAAWQELAKVL